jgi:hypothetical protein
MRAIGRFATVFVTLMLGCAAAANAADDTILLKCTGTKEWSGTDLPQRIDNSYTEYVKIVTSLRVFRVYWPTNKQWEHNECRVHGTNCTFNESVLSWDRISTADGISAKKNTTVEKRSIDRKTGKSDSYLREQTAGTSPTVLQIVLTHTECENAEMPTSHFRLRNLFRMGK